MVDFLKTCKEPVSRRQIAEALNENVIKISHVLAILIRWSEIEFVEYSGEQVKQIAGYSPGRRTRFYFVNED